MRPMSFMPRLSLALAAACCAAPPGPAAEKDAGRAAWTAPAEAREAKNPVAASADSLARGKALYAKNCLSCHGEKGDGKGPVALRLGFSAGDLSDASAMGAETDGSIFWKIASGREPMPSFRNDVGLTDAQIWDLVNFARTLVAGGQTKPSGK